MDENNVDPDQRCIIGSSLCVPYFESNYFSDLIFNEWGYFRPRSKWAVIAENMQWCSMTHYTEPPVLSI